MVTAEMPGVEGLSGKVSRVVSSRQWKRTVVVLNDELDEQAGALVRELARRSGTEVILYDVKASSGWTSPFPPGERVQPVLLDEPGVRRSGRDAIANGIRDLQSDGVVTRACLSNSRDGGDLRRLVALAEVDLVICPIPVSGGLMRAVQSVRQERACLLQWFPGQSPELFEPITDGSGVPTDQRIQMRFLIGVFVTFILAGLRNRSGS